MRVCALISGGKDSWYATYVAMQYGFEISTLVTFVPRREDSYMLHHVNVRWAALQAGLAGIRHSTFEVSGEKEREVEEMKRCLAEVVKNSSAEAIVCGAVRSDYQKQRIDTICEELGVKSYAPLWHKNEETLLREMVGCGFEFLVTRIAVEMEEWLGKSVNEKNIDEFIACTKKERANAIGEGGEYETFLLNAPVFERKIHVVSSTVVRRNADVELIFRSLKHVPKAK